MKIFSMVFLSVFFSSTLFAFSFDGAEYKVVNTVSELSKIEKHHKLVRVLGFNTVNDGGGGLFYFDAASSMVTNNTLVIQAKNMPSGRYIRILEDKVNLKWFGAVGDGTFDNTEALTHFFEFLNKGYAGYIPKGDYVVNQSIRIKLKNDISIESQDNAKIIAGKLKDPMLTFDGNGHKLKWIGGRLDTQNSNFVQARQSGTALSLKNFSKIFLSDITFYSKTHYTDARASKTGDSGITVVNSKNAIISNNYFTGFPDAAIYLSGGASETAVDDGESYIISNNIFKNCNIGITMKRQLKEVLISNNLFHGNRMGITTFDTKTKGSYLKPGENISIVNNIFKNTESTAMELRNGSFNLVTGNMIIDWGYTRDKVLSARLRPAIWLRGISYSIVKDNLISMKNWKRTNSHKNIEAVQYKTESGILQSEENEIEGKIIYGNR
jgi:hypothetical protein